jgi:signal peptidase I
MAQTDKKSFNKNADSFKNTAKNALIFDLLIIMFVVMMAFGASVVVREYVVSVTEVLGTSMEDTLQDGDYVYLLNYPLIGKIKRGDIVRADNPLYDPAVKDDPYIIKRVVAIGGDEVKIPGDGYVYVNGEQIDDSYTKNPESTNYRDGVDSQGRKVDPDQSYKEGKIVPKGCVFILGDNRTVSKDSRSFGEIKEDTVYGRAFMIRRDGKIIWL